MKIIILIIFANLLSFSAHSATIIPFEREVSRIDEFAFLTSSFSSSSFYRDIKVGDEDRRLYFQGFGLTNIGPNEIVPTIPSGLAFANRNFTFVNTDKSRRDNYLWITDDIGTGQISDLYETVMVFLPRENQMHIEENGEKLIVTLNNGEEIHYTKLERKIISGVLKEQALDFNSNRELRSFAKISYEGEGIVIRSDARAADPRLAKKVQILRKSKDPCFVSGSLFWTQKGFPKFRYITDEEAYKIIDDKCGSEFLK